MSSGTRSAGAAGAGGNNVPQVTQPTQAELDATALALANQQEMDRLRQLETERSLMLKCRRNSWHQQ